MFTLQNPLLEDLVTYQIAMIAQIFANSFIKRKDRQAWVLEDFIPKFGGKASNQKQKTSSKMIKKQALGMLVQFGDKKAKNKAKKALNIDESLVKGTDGKMYKYRLEEFAPKRTTLPKRLQRLQNKDSKVGGQ